MLTSDQLEYQKKKLESLLKYTPEKIGTKYNSRHFALKGKIAKIAKLIIETKNFEYSAQ